MKLSSKVSSLIRTENISPEELFMMVKNSAITSLDGFNKRYFHWLLKVENSELVDMQQAKIVEIGKGDSRMIEDHEPCNGFGCSGCGWRGEIGRWVSDRDVSRHKPSRIGVMT